MRLLLSKHAWHMTLFVAFCLYLAGSSQSLWLDEGVTARVVKEYGFIDIIRRFSPLDFHPPLYYLFMKLWTSAVGYSEVALRLPSAVFALLTGIVIYHTAKHLKLTHPAYAACLFLFQPLIVYYAQEARMYLMAVFFLSVMYFFALKKNYPGMGVAAVLSLCTFYGSLFAIAALFLWQSWKREYRIAIALSISTLFALIVLSPLLIIQLHNAQAQLVGVDAWRSVLGTVTVKNLLLIPLKFAVGRISFEPKILYWIISGIWVFIVGSSAYLAARKNRELLFLVVAPIVLGALASFITPLLSYFRFLYIAVPLSLLLAYSSKRAYIVLGFVIWSLTYLLFPFFHRENWKNLSAALSPTETIYGVPSSLDALRYYRPSIIIRDIRTKQSNSMTVVPYTLPLYGIAPEPLGFRVTKTRHYRGVSIEYWHKKAENK